MATPLIDNWVTVELLSYAANQLVETIFTYKSDTNAITAGDLEVFVNDWAAVMLPLAQAITSVDLQFARAHAKTHFKTFPNVEAIVNFPEATNGTRNFPIQPGNVTIATSLLTGILGRRNRGRQFMYGLSEADCYQNYASSTLLLGLGTLFTRHILGFNDSGVTYLGAIASRAGEYIRVDNGLRIDAFLDSMRRRLANRGR